MAGVDVADSHACLIPSKLPLIKEAQDLDFKESEKPGIFIPALYLQPVTHQKMKVSLVALAFLLAIATLHSEAQELPKKQVSCCLAFISRKIQLRHLRSYEWTSDQCSMPGVIFLTKKGRQICADPRDAWVKETIRNLDSKSQLSGSGATTTTQGI
ncbi:regakine-1-like [Erinaceus europaeus]|uniref:C-C motif chemokine n=1 Tax=Erinaceus europaeus TaxID=9365 RepID=A0ABM3YBN0_ERIEU|nr:regakine-1-like [Erinaceus europaeus]